MKLIHTADWHLGQTFYEYDRRSEHTQFLTWLRSQVKTHEVDVLLIAGDVFDTPNPSADAQRQFYTFLKDITRENPDLQIIIIAGNHDSAARLEAPNPLLQAMNTTIRGVVRRTEEGEIDFEHLIIPLNKGGYCLAVPYLRQGDYPQSATYAEGVQAMYREIFEHVEDKSKPIIAMGHLHATGSEISQNDRAERAIIGGLECISSDAFNSNIAYTALGHLHRAQRVSERENVRYAGAPLPMSFAEKNNKQGVTLITLGDETQIERVEFDASVKLMSIEPGLLTAVLEMIQTLPEGEVCETSPFLEIRVQITEPEPSLRVRVEQALEGKAVRLARIEAIMPRGEVEETVVGYEAFQQMTPLEIATHIFRRKYRGEDMPENMTALLQTVIREVQQ